MKHAFLILLLALSAFAQSASPTANRKEVWPAIRVSRRSLSWIFQVAESRCQPVMPRERPPLCPEDHGAW